MNIDFFIVGAQKAGTTTLHMHLSTLATVALPKDKESPFLLGRPTMTQGEYREQVADTFGAQARAPGVLRGVVTPQYLGTPGIAEVIRRLEPEARVAAVLRHPLDRAYSAYQMQVRRGIETRSFEDAAWQQLQDPHLSETTDDERHTYVAWSEYGRLLGPYHEGFAEAGRLHVLFTDELEADPTSAMRGLLSFLSVDVTDATFPAVRANAGGERRRYPDPFRFLRGRPGWSVLRRLSPTPLRRWFRARAFAFDATNARGSYEALSISRELRDALEHHFGLDLRVLTELLARPHPWPELRA